MDATHIRIPATVLVRAESLAKMSEHYSHVTIDERKTAVDTALALVRESGDKSGDTSTAANEGEKGGSRIRLR